MTFPSHMYDMVYRRVMLHGRLFVANGVFESMLRQLLIDVSNVLFIMLKTTADIRLEKAPRPFRRTHYAGTCRVAARRSPSHNWTVTNFISSLSPFSLAHAVKNMTRTFSDTEMFPFGHLDDNGPPLFGHAHFSIFSIFRYCTGRYMHACIRDP